MRKTLLMISLCLIFVKAGYCTEYHENWAFTNNSWLYWDENGELQPGGWYLHDLPMPHRSTGGQGSGDTGYVYCNLNEAGLWQPGTEDMYWPAYLVDAQNQPLGAGGNIADHYCSIFLNDLGSANLMDGTIHFFIGEYVDLGGGNGAWTWFMLKKSVAVGNKQWEGTTFKISSNENDWTKFDGGAGIGFNDIITAPQQYGFGIKDVTAEPSGELGFDTFSISAVPEPASIALGFLGLCWLFRAVRKKSE